MDSDWRDQGLKHQMLPLQNYRAIARTSYEIERLRVTIHRYHSAYMYYKSTFAHKV